jgi:hypothetical protein
MGCMAQYSLRLRDWGIGNLAAKLYIIFTFPQEAGYSKHSRMIDHLLVARSTM